MANGTRRNYKDIQGQAKKQLRWLVKGDGDLSQQEAGERLGLLQQSVSRILNSKDTNAPILPIAILIGYVFRERCAELDIDPATVDLDTPARSGPGSSVPDHE